MGLRLGVNFIEKTIDLRRSEVYILMSHPSKG